MTTERQDIRNIAIIAHVDHGKTTLVDELLKQSGTFRKNQVVRERVMDSNDLERERGITILAKNTAVFYKNCKINIIDTPGHADFGGEVERVLKMVNGVVLVVDAVEGPMPQTKFVLKNALSLDLPVVVCINKTDRHDVRVEEVINEVLELLIELEANEKQLDSPFIFTSAKKGTATSDDKPGNPGEDMAPLFDAILNHIPAPSGDIDAPFQVLISTIDYNEYLGRIGIGKIENGVVRVNDEAVIVNMHKSGSESRVKITKLYEFEGLGKVETKEASVGEIVAVSGIEDIHIGDTICSPELPEPLPFVKISEPTIAMNFLVNDSPFAGTEGKFVTSRRLRERLLKELNTNVSLRVEETETTECFKVSGRGELHLSILIENMRREGYEFQVSKPEVLFKREGGTLSEPIETVVIDVPEEFVGTVIEKLGARKGELRGINPAKGGYSRITMSIPARGLIGYRSEFMTDTKGNGIINSVFEGYEPYKGDILRRLEGSLVAFEAGEASPYGLYNSQERGELFIGPQTKVYAGMIVGRSPKRFDLEVNVCKKKQLTNMRAAGSDTALRLTPPLIMSLEQCLEFITDDELVEITPENLRMRKKILDSGLRAKSARKSKEE